MARSCCRLPSRKSHLHVPNGTNVSNIGSSSSIFKRLSKHLSFRLWGNWSFCYGNRSLFMAVINPLLITTHHIAMGQVRRGNVLHALNHVFCTLGYPLLRTNSHQNTCIMDHIVQHMTTRMGGFLMEGRGNNGSIPWIWNIYPQKHTRRTFCLTRK